MKKEINIEQAENLFLEEALINQTKSFIKLNPLQLLLYNKLNQMKKIFFYDSNIKRIIYQIRNDLYLKDDKHHKYIKYFTIKIN